MLRRIYRLAKHIELPCCCSKQVQAPGFVFSGTGFTQQYPSRGRTFRVLPGFKHCPFRDSCFGHAYALSVPAFGAFVVIIPVSLITSVGIGNFNIPGNPGSPDWLSALRLPASSGFGPVGCSVARIAFPAVCRASAIVGITHTITLRLLFVSSLHDEYHQVLTAAKVFSFLLASLFRSGFSRFGFNCVLFPIRYLNPFAFCIFRCASTSIPCGQSVQGATCPLTLSCIPAFNQLL